MDIFRYSVKNVEDVAFEFGVDIKSGLSKKEFLQRYKKFGPNKLDLKGVSPINIFLRQFKSPFIYLLFGAMVVAISVGELIDSLMIFIFLMFNTLLGFFQEYTSEKTAQMLNKYILPKIKVLREGKIEWVRAYKLVPGDIIILKAGDKVPADVRLIEQEDLSVDESILTGESVPVLKTTKPLKSIPSSYHEASNLVFSGTYVLKGNAKAIVLFTGRNTVFGRIAKLTVESKKISEFERDISQFSKFILKLVGFVILIVFFANLFINRSDVNVFDLLIFSIALTVSVVPEALPLVITFSLSQGARRLSKKKIIVKRLSAVEDLGSIEVLCSDKTGTLTENKMKIKNIFSNNPEETIWLANLASSFEVEKKIEPFDIALENALSQEQKIKIKNFKKIKEEPFDPKTRENIVLVDDGVNKIFIERGAPEVILPKCHNLNEDNKEKIYRWIKQEGERGYRVLAVGYKKIYNNKKEFDLIALSKAGGLNFSGIISFTDSIKKSAFEVVKNARQLGVKIIILTGDRPEVAGAVAKEIGLIDSPDKVISGEQWKASSEKQKEKYLEEYSVFARVSPEEKFDIIQMLRKRYTVGFLGEGINDAPALKIAGVSLVVDSAADIAREAADIILLRNNLQVVIDGIKEGRKVFANTTKYIKATLSSNFGNFFAIATASLVVNFLPMLPIQILLVNLLTDMPLVAISTDNVDKSELRSPKRYDVKEIIIVSIMLGVVSTIFDFMFFGLFHHISPEVLQTNWFIGSVLTELILIFSIRSRMLFFKSSLPSKFIIILSIIIFILTLTIPFTSMGQEVFRFVPPTMEHLGLIILLVVAYFFSSEFVKFMYYDRIYYSDKKMLNGKNRNN
ncbi:Magnesium-transporting ATPase, P-type 1 [bacterium HR34]|nr:Magnesium-transporting ATPase, P-type 1 [bacterium HR34]